MWKTIYFVLLVFIQITQAQDDAGDALSRLLEDVDGEFIDSIVGVAESLVNQIFPASSIPPVTVADTPVTVIGEPSTVFLTIPSPSAAEDENSSEVEDNIFTVTDPASSIATESLVLSSSAQDNPTTNADESVSETNSVSQIANAVTADEDTEDEDETTDGEDDGDKLGIILGSVFGALALLLLGLLFFCCRRRRSKKKNTKTRDLSMVEKDPSDSDAFLPGSPTAVRTNQIETYHNDPAQPAPIWASGHQRRPSAPTNDANGVHRSFQPVAAAGSTDAGLEGVSANRPVIHPGIGELPADAETRTSKEPSTNEKEISELSSNKYSNDEPSLGVPSTMAAPTPTGTATRNPTASSQSASDHLSYTPWLSGTQRTPTPASIVGSASGPYGSDIHLRDQLSRSPPPLARVPSQYNPYAHDENIYDSLYSVDDHNHRVQSLSAPLDTLKNHNLMTSNTRHESYNSTKSSNSNVSVPSLNRKEVEDRDNAVNTASNTHDPRHSISLNTTTLPEERGNAEGYGDVSPLMSPSVRHPHQAGSGQYHCPSPTEASDFNFGFVRRMQMSGPGPAHTGHGLR